MKKAALFCLFHYGPLCCSKETALFLAVSLSSVRPDSEEVEKSSAFLLISLRPLMLQQRNSIFGAVSLSSVWQDSVEVVL